MVLQRVEDSKEMKHIIKVVKELPMQPVRQLEGELNGEKVILDLVTFEEALEEVLNARAK